MANLEELLKDLKIDPALEDPKLFINRELSQLEFFRRVLEEAQDHNNPLLERVKFLSIVGSNLDEFHMVRTAGLKQQVSAGIIDTSPDGMTPAEQLAAVRRSSSRLMNDARTYLQKQLLPELDQAGIHILDYAALDRQTESQSRRVFRSGGVSRFDAAGRRSRPALSAHLQPQPQSRHHDSRPQGQ